MSVVREPGENSLPGCFAVLTWWMANGDDHKCGLIGIITLDQGKRSLCEQSLAGLVLGRTRSASTYLIEGPNQPIGKNQVVRSPRDLRDRVSLL